MKRFFKILIIAFLLCIFTYICKINSIPENIILYNGEILKLCNFPGLSLKLENKDYNSVLVSSNMNNANSKNTVKVKLFDFVTIKEINVSVLDKTTVIPVGQVSGLKLYTNGVLIVGMGEIKGEDNNKYKPYKDTEIKEGDRITKIDDTEISDTNSLINIVNKSNGKSLKITYIRDNEELNTNIIPKKTSNNEYKLGLWVRDSAAGIGTLSFYEPSTGNFAALGHRNNRSRYRRFNKNSKWRVFKYKNYFNCKRAKRESTEKFKVVLKIKKL